MTEHTWLGMFVLMNLLQFAFGIAITGLSYLAYRKSGKTTFRNSTIGFLLITIGGVSAPVYQLGIRADYVVTGRELLELQIIEGTLIAVGLAFLLFSVYTHSTTQRVPADSRVPNFEERENH